MQRKSCGFRLGGGNFQVGPLYQTMVWKQPFQKEAPKLVLFLPEKSFFWPDKSSKSDFHSFSLPHRAKIYSKISLNMEYFQIKFYGLNFKIKFLERV